MENRPVFTPNRDAKLMDQVREVMRFFHYAYRTERTYCMWISRFVKFHHLKHPSVMAEREVEQFLSHLASGRSCAASTQRQALNAIVFLYRDVLHQPLSGKIAPVRSKRFPRPPEVLTQDEVLAVLSNMQGTHALMAKLLYGCGLRLMECIRLRIQDVNFSQGYVYVRGGKGGKDRAIPIPEQIRQELYHHVERVKELHVKDLEEGFGAVHIPEGLARKYPYAEKQTSWQYVFPAKRHSVDPRSGKTMRHHVLPTGLQKAVKTAVRKAGIDRRIGCHTLRHSYATHLLENGVNIRMVQQLMGHSDVKTTEIYTHVMKKDIHDVKSPLDMLEID